MGVLLGNEVSLITAVTPTTLTVTRARIGTTAVASVLGASITILQSGDYGWFVKNVLIAWAKANLLLFPGPATTTAEATIATQQATIITLETGAIQ